MAEGFAFHAWMRLTHPGWIQLVGTLEEGKEMGLRNRCALITWEAMHAE